jgi:hypothetical protein
MVILQPEAVAVLLNGKDLCAERMEDPEVQEPEDLLMDPTHFTLL